MREHGPPQLLHLLVSCVLLGDNIRGLEGLILVYAIFLPSDYCTVFADYYGVPANHFAGRTIYNRGYMVSGS